MQLKNNKFFSKEPRMKNRIFQYTQTLDSSNRIFPQFNLKKVIVTHSSWCFGDQRQFSLLDLLHMLYKTSFPGSLLLGCRGESI
jgi:hypothetical protein